MGKTNKRSDHSWSIFPNRWAPIISNPLVIASMSFEVSTFLNKTHQREKKQKTNSVPIVGFVETATF